MASGAIQADDDEFVQVVDGRGAIVVTSHNVAGRPAVAALGPAEGESLAVTVKDPAGLEGTFRVVAIVADDPQPVTIYVGTNLKQADSTTVLLASALVVAVPLLLALVAAMTWVAVGRSLRPVEAIRRQVADVSAHDPGVRVPVPGTDDELRRLALTMNAMLDRLQASSEREARFVADASHELQTPIAAARTELEVALARPPERWEEIAQRLLETNREMEQLVTDLLFIARSDDGAPRAEPFPVDLHEVVLDEVSRLRPSAGVPIDTLAVSPAVVRGRRDDLARVVRNLLDNAVRYADVAVAVQLCAVDGTAVLRVADDGPGIPTADSARVFDRFSRVDDGRDRGSGGTGLGLAIAKEIVQDHHGTIAVSTEGAGTTMVVCLPLE